MCACAFEYVCKYVYMRTYRQTDKVLNKGDDVVVCFPGAKIKAITERLEKIMGPGKGGFFFSTRVLK